MDALPEAIRDRLRYALYLLFGKVLPGAVFTIFVVVQVQLLGIELRAAEAGESPIAIVSLVLNRALSLLFASAVALIYIIRRPPRQAVHGPVAFVVSMYASFGLLAIRPLGVFLATEPLVRVSGPVLTLSNLLVGLGIGFSLFALGYLRLNFSILPEARGLVRGGPYRLVRHPVYAGEILSGLGIVLALPNLVALLIWFSFVIAQVIRINLEEQVLTAQIPEYADYARSSKRLVPFIY